VTGFVLWDSMKVNCSLLGVPRKKLHTTNPLHEP